MVQHKTSDQYLTSGKVSTWSIHRFKRYSLLKTLTKNFNIFSNANANADADTVTASALDVLLYRRAKETGYSYLDCFLLFVIFIFNAFLKYIYTEPSQKASGGGTKFWWVWNSIYPNDPKFLDRQDWSGQTEVSPIRVWTFCCLVCIFWMYYCMVKSQS